MRTYERYMDRQTVSPSLHNQLLALEQRVPDKKSSSPSWRRAAVLAACLCLLVGLGWFGRRAGLGSGGDNAASYSMTAEDTSAQTTEAAADVAGEAGEEAAADEAGEEAAEEELEAPRTEEPAEWTETEDCASAEKTYAWPENAVLPGWLPEGYTLTETEAGEDWYSLVWTSQDGEEITVEYGLGTLDTANVLYPVFPAGTTWEEAAEQVREIEGRWGFFLEYDGSWRCFITTGDCQELWQVAESFE